MKTREPYPRRKSRKSKKAQTSFSPLFILDSGTEYTTSENNSEPESSYRDHGREHCTKRSGDGRGVLRTVSTCLRGTVHYETYWLENKLSSYDRTVLKNINKMSKRMTAQIKPRTLDLFDPISSTGFLCNLKLACDTNRIHEGEAMWL